METKQFQSQPSKLAQPQVQLLKLNKRNNIN